MKPILQFLILLSLFADLFADKSTEEHLEELDKVLTSKEIREFLSKKHAKSVVSLAMDEDLDSDYPNFYLLSDEMLNLLRKDKVLKSDFAKKIEAFQAYIDTLKGEEKALAISTWKSLWLDKVSEYQVYLQGLKKRFSWDITQAFNYDTNIRIVDNDDVSTGKSDAGASVATGLNWKPFINHKKDLDWRYVMRFGANRSYQNDEDDLQYDYLIWTNRLTYLNLTKHITSLSFGLSGTFAYNQGSQKRYEFNQWALTSRISFIPFDASQITFGHFKSAIQQASIRYRLKEESARDGFIEDTDVNIITLSYGHIYSQVKTHSPFQVLSWDLSLENQSVDNVETRDYTFFRLRSYYSRDISSLIKGSNLSWDSRASIRLRNWSDPSAGTREDEEEYMISTSISNTWTQSFSSSLSINYRKRNQGINGDAVINSDQWRFVLTNTIISL